MPSFPGSGSIWLTVAPVHAQMAGSIRTVLPTGEKREIGGAAHAILAIGSVVIHVAFRRMRLAPAVFARGDILRFSKVGRALIKVVVEIIDLNANPVRHAVVVVAAVIVRSRWKVTSEWIDPGARTDLVLVAI